MSRSTRSSTRLRDERSPSRVKTTTDPIPSATSKLTELVAAFVNAASNVQLEISAETANLFNGQTLLHAISTEREGFEELCSRITDSNNMHKSAKFLQEATSEWDKLMKNVPLPTLRGLTAKKKRDLCNAGRNLASSLIITGHIYSGLSILREVVDINDYDPVSAVILLRWLVRDCEWEALESFLKADTERKRSNFEELADLLSICLDILEFHRCPKGREERAVQFIKLVEDLNKKEKSFQVFEAQILLYGALFLVSKVAGIRTSNMLDPLFCIDMALQKAETVAKSRWPGIWFDKEIETLKTKMEDSYGYLKSASAVAEYFEVNRMAVNEFIRCCVLRESSQYGSIAFCNSIRIGFPVWMTQSLSLLLTTRLRCVIDPDDSSSLKTIVFMIFRKEDARKKKNEEASCIAQITDQFNKLTPFAEWNLHIPSSSSSSCGCYLCLEYSFNPNFAFLCYKLALLHSEYSVESICSLVDSFTPIRSQFAPFQLRLMKTNGVKPRPPSIICDETGHCVISFLLSPTGLAMGKKDADRVNILTTSNKICMYSTQLCLPYRLILRVLTRKPRTPPSYPWMSRRSIMTRLADVSIGSEGRGKRATPSRSPFTPNSTFGTPNRTRQSEKDTEKEKKEDEEERNDYASYGHLLYHDWRSRVCEQLCLKSSNPWEKAMYLSETVAVATREGRRLLNGQVKPFGFTRVEEFTGAVRSIPVDMTVNQLIVSMSGDLYLIKVHATRSPIVVPLAREAKWSAIMDGFGRAMVKSDESAQAGKTMTDPKKYWEGRRKAEEMMKRAMIDMESDLLGAFAPLLLPSKKLSKIGEAVVSSVCRRGEGGMGKEMGREMVSIAAQINPEKFKQLVECMGEVEGWSRDQVGELILMKKGLAKDESDRWIVDTPGIPFVFFVLSTELSRAPWEAVTILEKQAHCSRLVSIHQLMSLLNSFNKIPHSANPLCAFYILDPSNDLANTKERLTPVVEKLPWKGVVGKAPEKEQIASIIAHNDFFIFLGHGNGLRYMSRSAIRRCKCKAVVLLMGCSSVYTLHEGRGMDGKGAVLDFSVASCPCIVGCIYLVTDGEIDKYFTALVDEGLARHLDANDTSPSSDLRLHLEAMARARTKVKLPYLTGSTVVSYGIPIDIRVQ